MRRSHLLTTAAILPLALCSASAFAQTVTLDEPLPRLPLDENGVILSTGGIVAPSSSVSIGGAGGLTHSRARVANGWRHNYILTVRLENSGNNAIVSLGGSSHTFTLVSGSWVSDQKDGSTLTSTSSEFTLTTRQGAVYTFDRTFSGSPPNYYGAQNALGTSITYPDGTETTLHYRVDDYLKQIKPGIEVFVTVIRLQSVTNNLGYMLKFSYVEDFTVDGVDDWYEISQVTAINNRVEYCDPDADGCSLSNSWPYLAYSTGTSGSDTIETVTDALSNSSSFTIDSSKRLKGYRKPSETSDGVTITWNTSGRVSQVDRPEGYSRTYSWATGTNELTMTSDDALGRERIVKTDTAEGVIKEDTDARGKKTTYGYDTDGRVTSVTLPEGNSTNFEYAGTAGDRGNVTKTTLKAKPGSSLSDIVTTTTFPSACTNPVTCNKPTSSTDALGNTTDYEYDPTHGGLTKVTSPADDNGVRPETRVTYVTKNARYLNGTSSYTTSGPIYRMTKVSSCMTGTAGSCAGTANERVIEAAYPSSSTPNNLQASTVTQKAGNNTLSVTSTLEYDDLGRLAYVDGPLTGTNDKTRTIYDITGRTLGQVGTDSDGGGGSPRPASRFTYDADGNVTVSESGTVAGLTDANWSAFSAQTKSVATYDDAGRTETQAQVATSGTTQYSLTQFSYDSANRPTCTAVRMNAPTTGTSLPASACTPMTAGSFGPDRISKNVYTAADFVTEVRSGVGTSLEQVTQELAYTDNGLVSWVEDAEDNRTTYLQDGFDRGVRVKYPSKTTSGASNSSDDQLFAYDANGKLTSYTTRRNEVFNFTYDDLGRLTITTVPERTGLASDHTRDIYYAYDLHGNLMKARFTSLTGDGLTFTYDALGRQLTNNTNLGNGSHTLTYGYDSIGRRTSIAHPDGNAFTYQYDDDGKFKKLMLNASANLVTNSFDTLRRLTGIARQGAAPEAAFGYDAAWRMNAMDIANGSSIDAGWDFAFDPAGNLASETRDNDAYAWGGHVNVNRAYTPNGLNQYSQVAGTNFTYDANGNLTSDGTTTFTYDPANLLVATSGTGTPELWYDPLGRLYKSEAGGNETWYEYDGQDLVAEYDGSGTLLNRYAHGIAAGDDPLVAYEGSGVTNGELRYLYGDRLGSIVLTSNRSGSSTQISSYGEYGIPDAGNAGAGAGGEGRFQYTGQVWRPELGMYYYKSRMYSPTLGRFMQTDPIGYADGMNMYRYVGNEPINGVDPTGMSENRGCRYMSRTELWFSQEGDSFSMTGVTVYDTVCFWGEGVPRRENIPTFPENEIVVRGHPEKDKSTPGKPQSGESKQPSVSDCLLFAGKKNGVNLALDAGGALLVFASAEFQVAAAIGGSILGVIGIGTSIANEDATGAGLAFAGKQAANAGGIAKVGSALARGASRFGAAAVAASSARDLAQAYQDYQQCRAGAGK